MPSSNRTTRDAGLRQVSTATKWIAGAAALLTGVLTVWEARTVHHAGATPPTATTPSTEAPAQNGGSDGFQSPGPGYSDPGSSSGDLQAPDTAPAPTDRQPAASSGGS